MKSIAYATLLNGLQEILEIYRHDKFTVGIVLQMMVANHPWSYVDNVECENEVTCP